MFYAAHAEDYLHVIDFSTEAGITAKDPNKSFDLELVNEVADTYTALQFDLYLPSGMTLAYTGAKGYDCNEARLPYDEDNEEFLATISITKKEDGHYLVTLYHEDLDKIHGTSGAIMKFYYKTSADMTAGEYEIKVTEQTLSKSGTEQVYPADKTSKVTITSATSVSDIEQTSGDNSIYDLTGRRINAKPAKGLYIENGKKIAK